MADDILDPDDPNASGVGGIEDRRVAFWKQEIQRASDREKHFRRRARATIRRYDEENEDYYDESGNPNAQVLDPDGSRFNILWANTETLRPALYQGTPRPVIKRRHRTISRGKFAERDVAAKEAAMALERCIEFSTDQYDFDEMAEDCITDHLLPGRMVARVNFRSVVNNIELERQESDDGHVVWVRGGQTMSPDRIEGDTAFIDQVALQQVWCTHIPWSQFRHSKAKKWRKVWWVAFEEYLNRDQVEDAFGAEMAERVDYRHERIREPGTEDEKNFDEQQTKGHEEPRPVAQFWQIWNKRERKVHTICDGLDDEFVQELDDPLKVKGFFPMPAPVMSVPKASSLVPTPEYVMYQDQAMELDEVTGRISALTRAMKAVGAYDSTLGDEVQQLFQQNDLKLVPIQNFGQFAERGGLRSIDWMPIEQYSKAVDQLSRQRAAIVQIIYEITGISDLLRGATDPRETASAQNLKAQFGSRRLVRRQKRIERFFRDLYRLKAEIIAEHFTRDQIELMANMALSDDAMKLLRSDAVRDFLVDVETGSTAAPDEQQDKRDATELFSTIGNVAPMLQQFPPQIATMMMLFIIRQFRAGREIEDRLIEFAESLKDQPPPENPEVVREKGKVAVAQRDQQFTEQVKGAEQKLKVQVAQAESERKDAVAAAEIRRADKELAAKIKRENRLAEAKIDLIEKEKQQELDFKETREMVATKQKLDESPKPNGKDNADSGKAVVVVEHKQPPEIDEIVVKVTESSQANMETSVKALQSNFEAGIKTLLQGIMENSSTDTVLRDLLTEQREENEQRAELLHIAEEILALRKEESQTLQ